MENLQTLPPSLERVNKFLRKAHTSRVSRLLVSALLLSIFIAVVLYSRNVFSLNNRKEVPLSSDGESVGERQEELSLTYQADDEEELRLGADGLPIDWEYSVPLYPSSSTIAKFQVGGARGIYLGVADDYSLVGQYYQTLSDKFPDWVCTSAYEDEGDSFLSYEYTYALEDLRLRAVIYHGSKEGYATTYSLWVEERFSEGS